MRSFYITLSVIVLLLLGWFYINNLLNDTILELNKDLASLQNNLANEDWKEAEAIFETIHKKWYNLINILMLISNHDEIEKTNLSLSKVNEYIKKREYSLLIGEIASLKYFINHIKDNESLSLSNIF